MEGLYLRQTTESGLDLYPSAQERLLRQQGMRDYIEQYMLGMDQGTIDPGLLPYQKPHFPKVLKHFHDHLKSPVNPEDPDLLDQLTYVQVADAATGFGKSFFIVRLAEAVGIGQPAHEYSQSPLRALFLSYRTLGVDELYKACQQFVPHINTTRHEGGHATKKGVSGQIVVMTYAALCRLMQAQAAGRRTVLDGHFFDLICTDENHHRWSEEFRAAVDRVARGALEFGASGTLRTKIKDREPPPISFHHRLRTMVDNGDAPSVQLLGFPTGQDLKAKEHTDDPYKALDQEFTWAETRALALNTERNVQIVERLKQFALLGRVSLAGMIPGGGQLHARLIETLVNKERITDPITGDERNLNFAAIGRFLPDAKVDELLERAKIPFGEEGSIDGLLSTSLLTESVDNPNFDAFLAACPYPYGQLAQLVGRLMRQGPHEVVILVQLLDRITGSRRPAFLPEVFDESEFFNGMIIGPKEVEERYNAISGWQKAGTGGIAPRKPTAPKGPVPPLSQTIVLASVVQQSILEWEDALDVYLAERRYEPIVDETIVAGRREILDEPPKGSVRLQNLFGLPNVQQAGIGKHALYDLLQAKGYEYSLVKVPEGGYENYVHDGKGVVAFLEAHEFPEEKEAERRNLQELTVELSTSRIVLERMLTKLEDAGHDMSTEPRRSPITKREEDTWGPEQIELFRAEVAARKAAEPPPKEKPLVLVSAAAERLGVPRKDFKRYIETTFQITLPLYNSPERGGRQGAYCEQEHEKQAAHHFFFPKVPDDAILAETVAQRFDKTVEEVIAAAEACGHKADIQQGSRLVQKRIQTSEGVRWAPGSEYIYPHFFATQEAAKAVQRYFKEQLSAAMNKQAPSEATGRQNNVAHKDEQAPEPAPAEPITQSEVAAGAPASNSKPQTAPEPTPAQPPQQAQAKPQPSQVREARRPQKATHPHRTARREAKPQPVTVPAPSPDIPTNYRRVEEGLALLDARCDPALIGWLIVRGKNRLGGTPRKDGENNWFAQEDDIQALAEVVISYPLAQPPPVMETPPQIAHRYRQRNINITAEDIINLFQYNIERLPRLIAPESQVTHCRSIPGAGLPSTLRVYFKSQLVRTIDARINYLKDKRMLHLLYALRKKH